MGQCNCGKPVGGMHMSWCEGRPAGEAFLFRGSGATRTESVAHAYLSCIDFAGSALARMSRADWTWLVLERPRIADRVCPMRIETVPGAGRTRIVDMSDLCPEEGRRIWAVAADGVLKGHAELRDMAEGKLLARIEW